MGWNSKCRHFLLPNLCSSHAWRRRHFSHVCHFSSVTSNYSWESPQTHVPRKAKDLTHTSVNVALSCDSISVLISPSCFHHEEFHFASFRISLKLNHEWLESVGVARNLWKFPFSTLVSPLLLCWRAITHTIAFFTCQSYVRREFH